MGKSHQPGRANQRRRTRRDLLAAAAGLLKQGRTPSMDEVAEAAHVSRATAYRYFPTIEELLIEAPVEGATPDAETVFDGDSSADPVERLWRAEAALHEVVYRNQAQLRLMLAASLQRTAGAQGKTPEGGVGDVPVRQNRRSPLIEVALAPARHRLSDTAYKKLCASLALVFGPESMVVFNDVLRLDEGTARTVKAWAIEALVRAALEDSTRERG